MLFCGTANVQKNFNCANIIFNIYFYRVKHGAEIGSILINFELGILDEFINSLRLWFD